MIAAPLLLVASWAGALVLALVLAVTDRAPHDLPEFDDLIEETRP